MERFFKSINYIEEHMYDSINIHDIAKASHFSTYHFSRIFRSLVGDSPKEYLRKRRLTVAAERLVKSQDSILDIALDCQFESQQAFSRAFKQLFSMSPGQYRSNSDPFRLIYKDQFSPHMLNHLQNRLAMEPQIIERPELKTIGIANRYQEKDLDLGKLWSGFRPLVDKITNRVGQNFFGIYEEYEEEDDDVGFTYVCTVEVTNFDNVPKGMITRVIPANLYAVFEHNGPVSFLPETLKYIWGSWLPKSKYEYVERPDFELYPPQQITPQDPNRLIHLHIPIKTMA